MFIYTYYAKSQYKSLFNIYPPRLFNTSHKYAIVFHILADTKVYNTYSMWNPLITLWQKETLFCHISLQFTNIFSDKKCLFPINQMYSKTIFQLNMFN